MTTRHEKLFNMQIQVINFYAPAMIMAGALSVTPVHPSVRTLRTYVRTYVITYVCPDDVRSLTRILFIRILCNLVTLFSTMMSCSSLIMVHIAPGFQELIIIGPLFMKIHHFKRRPLSNSNIFYQNFMKLGHIV